MGNYSYLKDVIAKYYIRDRNRVVFTNNASLNQMAFKMWESLQFSEIDSSVLSKVINGSRLFTFRQLRIFCELLGISKLERKLLFDALIKDKLGESNNAVSGDIHLNFAKLSYSPRHNILKISSKSKKLFQDIMTVIAPKFNQKSKLGVKYTASCYYYFITRGVRKYDNLVESKFSNFEVAIPTCDFKKTVKGLENNCKCGYHLALYGIIKEYLKKRVFSRERIQNKVNRWIAFFFPKHAVLNYLQNIDFVGDDHKLLIKELKASIS